jgi:hypothetical protein
MRATVEIPLTQGLVAVVDVADYETVRPYLWCAARSGSRVYAVRHEYPRRMHTVLIGATLVDHADGDGLNNQRSNLRVATHAENMRNRRKATTSRSIYKGLGPTPGGRWRAFIRVNRKQLYLGTFATEADAALAYDDAARRHHGEYAALNFPSPGERSALT